MATELHGNGAPRLVDPARGGKILVAAPTDAVHSLPPYPHDRPGPSIQRPAITSTCVRGAGPSFPSIPGYADGGVTGITRAVKWRVKAAVGWVLFHTGLHRRLLRGRAIIALFHRVDDRYGGTDITVTCDEFSRTVRFFKRFCSVVTLGDLLERLRGGEDISGCVVITFDDGYLDNFKNAAPLLAKEGLPASFFVSTEFIESTRQPWWDEELGILAEWMNWEQVRSLHAQGFDICAHTMNHVDLGTPLDAGLVFEEIRGCRERLEKELGTSIEHFSYPYGRRDQITEENREAVRRAGFKCCLSAYGGTVSAGDDPFYLQRSPINSWHRSPYEFGFDALFGRL